MLLDTQERLKKKSLNVIVYQGKALVTQGDYLGNEKNWFDINEKYKFYYMNNSET